MSSETHNSVSDFLASESTKSNANVGSSAFSNEKRQMDSASSESSISAISLGVSSSSGFSSSASMQTQKTTGICYEKNYLQNTFQVCFRLIVAFKIATKNTIVAETTILAKTIIVARTNILPIITILILITIS